MGAGQLDRLWILDIDGVRLVVNHVSYDATPRAVLEELEAILRSIEIEQM